MTKFTENISENIFKKFDRHFDTKSICDRGLASALLQPQLQRTSGHSAVMTVGARSIHSAHADGRTCLSRLSQGSALPA
jgi:hypothetical protein